MPLAAEVLHDRLPERHARVIAARSRRAGSSDRGARSAGIAGSTEPCRHHGDPPLAERVLRQRRHVPALRKLHRRARLDQPGIALGDDLEPFNHRRHPC